MAAGTHWVREGRCAGTGKTAGSRHPQVESNVLVGAGATVLGNITVGKGAQVAAGSLVLRDVPPRAMVAGSPAHIVGTVSGAAPPPAGPPLLHSLTEIEYTPSSLLLSSEAAQPCVAVVVSDLSSA